MRHFYAEDMQAHPEQAQAIERAAEVLRGLGAEVREIRLAPLSDYATCTRIIIRCEAYAIHRHWLAERPGDYGDLARQPHPRRRGRERRRLYRCAAHAGAADQAHARGASPASMRR